MIRHRSIAWLALGAMLFGAVSPALAAVFAHTPAASARILGLPALPAPASDAQLDDHHAHHVDHDSAPPAGKAGGRSTHESHTIYCSFCLNPSSVTTLAAAPPALAALTLAFDVAAPVAKPQRVAPFLASYRSRAPPALS